VVLSLILTGPIVWAGRMLLADSETLTFAVGNPNGEEARFAAKLAAVLHNTNSRLRLKIVTNADNAKALAQFDRREADLVVLRTDAKVPPRALALAILDHDLVLLLSPALKTFKSSEDLQKQKKIAVWADGDSSAAVIRNIFNFADTGEGGFEGSVGTRRRDPQQAVRFGLWRGHSGRARVQRDEGQALQAICQDGWLHSERNRSRQGAGAKDSGDHVGDGSSRHAVVIAGNCRVGRGVTTPTPHRTGRAELPHIMWPAT